MAGMFGKSAAQYDPNGLSPQERMMLLGSTLRDVGSSLRGDDSGVVLNMQSMLAQRQKAAQQTKFMTELGQKLQGQQAMDTAAPPVTNGDGGDISAAFGPQPGTHQDAVAPLNINSPDLPSIVLKAQRLGVPLSTVLETLKAQQPNVDIGPGGQPYNKNDAASLAMRFRNPTNINGFVADLNKPQNEGQYFPKLPDGMIPDGKGGVVNVTGLTGATGAQEEASALGKTRGTMMSVPVGGGRTRLATGAQYLDHGQAGGFGVTQSPDDAAYAGDLAKASAAQYTGIQAAGQKAGTNITNFTRMNQLLDGLNTGRLTPTGLEFQKALSSVGIQPKASWGRVEAADALSKKLALDAMGGSLGAGFSNADRSFVEAMNPSIMNTPQGRAQMVTFGIARAKREQEIAQKARQWQQAAGRLDKPDRNGKTFFDYLDAWAEANPLMGRQ